MTEYEAYAICYAKRSGRRADMFIDGDPHDGPMPMNYYVWVLRSPERVFVVDIGFTEEVAARRGRTFLRCPAATLGMLGIDANAVQDVILTHLHNDHAGNYAKFPNARFHLQEAEMAYVTGKYMRYPCCGRAYEPEEVADMVRMNFQGRIEFYDGDAELADGLSIHRTGGHTAGLQFVRVRTRRGWLVLASDASITTKTCATSARSAWPSMSGKCWMRSGRWNGWLRARTTSSLATTRW